MIAPFRVAQPGQRYDPLDERQFRAQLEQYLKLLGGQVAPLSVPIIADGGANSVVTAVPAALTEWQGSTRWRTRVNLRDFATAELTCMVVNAGSTNALGALQYTADLTGASGWAYLDGTSGPSVSLASTGVKQSRVIITQAAQGDVLIRPVTVNGDGATNAAVGITRVVFR